MADILTGRLLGLASATDSRFDRLEARVSALSATPIGDSAWGSITGTISAQHDLQAALDGKQTAGSYLTTSAAAAAYQPLGSYLTTSTAASTYQPIGSYAAAVHTHAYTDILSVPTGTLLYRKTVGTGAAEMQTLATLKADLGLSGTNTGDQDLSGYLTSAAAASTYLTQANATANYQPKGTYATGTGTASGTNTGDETAATIKSKLGITTLSGSNTGDQDLSGYLLSSTAASTYQPVGSYLTANQTITLSGDLSGSGSTAITATIGAGAVTLAKMASVASGTVFYRKTTATGAPEVQTLATLKTDLGLTGTNSGDQTITLSGAISGSGAGAITTTLGTNVVGLTNMAQVATGTVFYRKTSLTGNPEVQTLATLKADLGLTGTNSGDQTITLTGDVTGTGTGSFVTAIGANKVTRSMLVATSGAALLGATAAGNVADLTGTQATALLDVVTSTAKGLAPASGGGTANFLRADGTWAAPTSSVGSVAWGAITGTLSSQTDLQGQLDLKATNAGPTFTGTITADNLINLIGNANGTVTVRHSGSTSSYLVLENTGGTYGTSRLTLGNENGMNGATFETVNTTITLVDLLFKTAAVAQPQGGIRFEKRTSGFLNGTVNSNWELQFYNSSALSSAPLIVGDGGAKVQGVFSATGAVTGSNLSGTNTGDETSATILSKLSGSNIATTGTLSAGDITTTGVNYFKQGAPASLSAAATLTIAQLLGGIVQYTGAAATLTLPTGTLADAGIQAGALAVDRAFEWSVINTGTGTATIGAGTGHTIVGSATVAAGASARFWTRKTAANTFISYRTA